MQRRVAPAIKRIDAAVDGAPRHVVPLYEGVDLAGVVAEQFVLRAVAFDVGQRAEVPVIGDVPPGRGRRRLADGLSWCIRI